MVEDDIFESYEDSDLEEHGEEATDKGSLQGDREVDFDTGFDDPKYDKVTESSRGTDYENIAGRVRTGKEGELDLSRVNLDSGGRASGDAGGDWEGNMVSKGGAVQTTGFVSDTRGSIAYTGGHEDVDPELQTQMSGLGLRLGVASVNMQSVGFALANTAYMKNKLKWESTPPWMRELMNEERRDKRASREWGQVREDSIHRHASGFYKQFLQDRTESDPYWSYMDSGEIAALDGIDMRSARQIAVRWKQEDDVKKLGALVVKYAAALEGIKPRSMQTKLRRNPELRKAAEIVFVCDAHACGVVLPSGFDRDQLLSEHGDELYELETPLTDQERRIAIIDGAHDYYKGGSLFPSFVWEPLLPTLNAVVALLEEAGIDLTLPEPKIDWSRV